MRERLKPNSPNQALERVIQTKHQFMPDITIKTLDEMERYAGPFQKGQDFAAIAVRRSCSAARCISSGIPMRSECSSLRNTQGRYPRRSTRWATRLIFYFLSESLPSHSSCLSCWASLCCGARATSTLDESGLTKRYCNAGRNAV